MRKTLIIIATGILVAFFPLLALPPRIEAWILLIIGLTIITFGLYERIVYREKNSPTAPVQEKDKDVNLTHAQAEDSDIPEENQDEELYYQDNRSV